MTNRNESHDSSIENNRIEKDSIEKIFMSAVIYVHNDEAYVEDFLRTVMEVVEAGFEHSEIICVNDYSNDASVEKLRRVGSKAKNTTVTVLNMSYFHGVEAAMNAGVDLAIGDFVLEFDSVLLDFQRKRLCGHIKNRLRVMIL